MKLLYLISIIIFQSIAFGQTNKPKWALQGAAFGHNNTVISANIERIKHFSNNNLKSSLGLGYGRLAGYENESNNEFVPAVNNLLLFTTFMYGKKHNIQLKIGYVASFSKDYKEFNIIYQKYESQLGISIGYRGFILNGLSLQLYPLVLFTTNPVSKVIYFGGLEIGGFW